MAGTPGEQSILDGINQRSEKNQSIQENIQELEQILQEQNLQTQSFEVLRDMLRSFADTVDDMSVEQKRLALRLIVRDIVWDGEKVHIYLFGDNDPDGDDIDFPPPDDGQDNPDGTLCEDSKVAVYVGLYRGTYAGYETPGARDYYPVDKLTALAKLFNVPLEYLLDDYNRFLYKGQGWQVQTLRERMGLSRREFADRLDVWPSTVRDWETNSVRMTKQTWKRLFRS